MPTCLEKSFAAFVRERTYLKNVSPRTVQWYGECLSWLKKYPLTADGIKEMVLGMREAGLKATSVNSRLRAANAYFRWAKLDLHADRMANSIRFSVSEAGGPGTGREVVLAKLSEVLFIETLRRFIQDLPDHQKGWLAGARDPVIGEALALLHKDPGHPWTIAKLARQVGVSRTRFAERFRRLLDEPPMAYLARWRLKLAAEILVSSSANVGEIAAEVVYASEAAFNRTFKREFGCPPAQFRRSRTSKTNKAVGCRNLGEAHP